MKPQNTATERYGMNSKLTKYDIERISKSPLFAGLYEDELKAALDALRASKRSFEKGGFILTAGGKASSFGLVLEGGATIENIDAWGNRTILSHVSRGDYFAEVYALLPEEVMPIDVRANEDSVVVMFSARGFEAMQADYPLLYTKMVSSMLTISLRKNMVLSGRSFHTAPKTIRGRVMAYLSSISLRKGAQEFDIPFDRQQLADYLNVERTALSKELRKMSDDGLIEFHRNHFRLL